MRNERNLRKTTCSLKFRYNRRSTVLQTRADRPGGNYLIQSYPYGIRPRRRTITLLQTSDLPVPKSDE